MRPCPHCQRPVRAREATCPFCAGAMPEGSAAGGTFHRLALGSAVIVAAAATSACPAYGGPVPPTPSGSPSPGTSAPPTIQPPYGAAPVPSPSGSPPQPQPLYGAPVPPSTSPNP